jgi:pyruvate kinase
MITAGMNIARLNYSHGDFATHAEVIKTLRKAEQKTKTNITIMADLPGPKIRIGQLKQESFILKPNDHIILSTKPLIGDWTKVSVSLPELPQAVREGDIIFLNDGLIQLSVISVSGHEILCRIVVGGELRANKGLNLPGINLGISAFTKHDEMCLKSALENGVDAISQSFVNTPEDVIAVRNAAKAMGYDPFIIAKMERSGALERIDDILAVSDGMMIARGDLGVEIPIEQLAIVQKRLITRANLFGKPVITATQMLESMVRNPRPTRAEATDVANAVLDGTDCIMLSEESAIGKYPIDAISTLAKIAEFTETHRDEADKIRNYPDFNRDDNPHITDTLAHDVYYTVEHLKPELLVAHTVSGHTARMISRFKLGVWILAVSTSHNVCQGLRFSFGVKPLLVNKTPKDWKKLITQQIQCHNIKSGVAILVEVPSEDNPGINHRLEIISDLSRFCKLE